MEASTLQAPAALARPRIAIGTPLLRLRSDDQLVALFRAGHDEAFAAIHERYHKRLLAYARQMLPQRQDAEEALQDVFVRAYSGLRAGQHELLLRPWLFRVAHNRCIDELRRPAPPPPEVLELLRSPVRDPIAVAEQRESLRRLIEDVRRLPGQQRSALLMRELAGLSYAELAAALATSIPAVKSLLVRARVALAEAAHARDMDCSEIRDEIASAHDRGTRPNATARKHLRDCTTCRTFRREVRGFSRRYAAALIPAVGPFAALAHMLGLSGGAGGGATATAGGATATAGGVTATAGGATATAGVAVGGTAVTGGVAAVGATGHLATLLAAAVATAGGAVGLQHTITSTSRPAAHSHSARAGHAGASGHSAGAAGRTGIASTQTPAPVTNAAAAIERMRPAAASPIAAGRANGRVAQGPGSTQGSPGSKPKHRVVTGGASTTHGESEPSSLLAASGVPTDAVVVSGSSSTTSDPSTSSCSTSSTSSPDSTSTSTNGGTSTSGSSTSSSAGTTPSSTTGSTSSGTTTSPDSGSGTGTSGSSPGSTASGTCGTSSSQSAATPT